MSLVRRVLSDGLWCDGFLRPAQPQRRRDGEDPSHRRTVGLGQVLGRCVGGQSAHRHPWDHRGQPGHDVNGNVGVEEDGSGPRHENPLDHGARCSRRPIGRARAGLGTGQERLKALESSGQGAGLRVLKCRDRHSWLPTRPE